MAGTVKAAFEGQAWRSLEAALLRILTCSVSRHRSHNKTQAKCAVVVVNRSTASKGTDSFPFFVFHVLYHIDLWLPLLYQIGHINCTVPPTGVNDIAL